MATTASWIFAHPLAAFLSGITAPRLLLGTAVIAPLLMAFTASAQPVTLDVHFKLTDLEYKPLAGVPVRLVFGSAKGWQAANAGRRVTTDANGEARLTVAVTLDQQSRRVPTNFIGSLLSGSQQADHLAIGAELPTMGYHWLYVIDIVRFKSGDVMLDDTSVYTPDAKGNFTLKARHDANGWHMPELAPLALSSLLYEPWDHMLEPAPGDATHTHWTLKIAFKKSPEPVRR